jgi:hypothetical protein
MEARMIAGQPKDALGAPLVVRKAARAILRRRWDCEAEQRKASLRAVARVHRVPEQFAFEF